VHVYYEKGAAMHAVFIPFTINDRDALPSVLDEVVQEVSAAPGFVSVYGMTLGQDDGVAVLVFDSEASASLQALGARVMQKPALTVGTPEVGEVVAHA
jgi:hypothetical protein